MRQVGYLVATSVADRVLAAEAAGKGRPRWSHPAMGQGARLRESAICSSMFLVDQHKRNAPQGLIPAGRFVFCAILSLIRPVRLEPSVSGGESETATRHTR